jgi:hypothetical protein
MTGVLIDLHVEARGFGVLLAEGLGLQAPRHDLERKVQIRMPSHPVPVPCDLVLLMHPSAADAPPVPPSGPNLCFHTATLVVLSASTPCCPSAGANDRTYQTGPGSCPEESRRDRRLSHKQQIRRALDPQCVYCMGSRGVDRARWDYCYRVLRTIVTGY